MRVLVVIPARGGSKGIPGKNIRSLHGKPLLAWTIESALNSRIASDVIVSTDDPETAEISRVWGAQVPFLRPAHLARDDTPGIMTAIHAAESLPEYEWLLLAQPTSPLRISGDLDGIVSECAAAGAEAAVSVVPSPYPPEWTFRRNAAGYFVVESDEEVLTSRQYLPPTYSVKGGGLYLAERRWLLRSRTYITPNTYMYVMPPERCVDIDTAWDWELAQALMGLRLAEREQR